MTKNIVEELPTRKHPVAVQKPEAGKEKPQDPEKKVKQAVYDIRYRARREDVPLRTAYSQYMSNSGLGGNERTIVKKKLFGDGPMKENFVAEVESEAKEALANTLVKVFVGEDLTTPKKYKVRVTDKSGKSYVRMADRAKITELRANSNIESVEMTSHGEPYEGEKKKGTQTAKAKGGGLDPVGKEDGDVDNDGDKDSSDSYLLKRRKAIAKAMAKEEFIADAVEEDGKKKKLDIMKGKNKVKILTKSKTGTYDEAVVSRFRSILAEEDKVEDKKKKEKEEVDPRGMKTAISLYKNKLRAMGMKMEHHQKDANGKVIEHDDEELQEIAPAIAAIPAALAKGAAVVGKGAMAAGKVAGKAVVSGTKAVGKAAGEGIKQGVKAGAQAAGQTVATAAGEIAANKLKQKAGMVAASNELEGDAINELKLSAKDKEGLNKSVKAAVSKASAKTGLNRPEAMRFEPKEEVEHLDELNKQERMETVKRGAVGVGKRFSKKQHGKGQSFTSGGNVGRRNISRFENKPAEREEGSLDKKRRQTFKKVKVLNPKSGYSKKSDAVGAGKKITSRKLSTFGSDMKTDYGPQKHHTQGVTSRDAAQAQRRSEHKARRGVKTKGTVASDIKKSLKETYTVTNADKKGNTPAYQGMKADKKNAITGEPLYKKADHMKEDKYISNFRKKLNNIK